jgi:hypothetical protein
MGESGGYWWVWVCATGLAPVVVAWVHRHPVCIPGRQKGGPSNMQYAAGDIKSQQPADGLDTGSIPQVGVGSAIYQAGRSVGYPSCLPYTLTLRSTCQ